MRVIAGSARHTNLKSLPGNDTRPTLDRVKETLFNMLPFCFSGCTFLDLFAGTGGIGIEALSRGADHCVFVDSGRKAAAVIRENLNRTHLGDRALILNESVSRALADLTKKGESFDYVFMDPPYGRGFERDVLTFLITSPLLKSDSLIIVEASLGTDFTYLDSLGYTLQKKKCYKTNQHLFLRKKNP